MLKTSNLNSTSLLEIRLHSATIFYNIFHFIGGIQDMEKKTDKKKEKKTGKWKQYLSILFFLLIGGVCLVGKSLQVLAYVGSCLAVEV